MRLALLPAILLLSGCDAADWGDARKYTEDFSFKYDLQPGGRISVENFNGGVEIYSWDQPNVEVTGAKFASREEDLARIKIDISSAPNRIQIRTVRPTEGSRRGSLGARYRINVPRKTSLERVETSNGPVRVEGLEGEGRITTSNGPIRLTRHSGNLTLTTSNGPVDANDVQGVVTVTTSNGPVTATALKGHLEVTTSNGPIKVDIAETQQEKPLRLRTSNGPVQVTLAARPATDVIATSSNGPITVRVADNVGLRLKARTSNSRIQSDLPVTGIVEQSKSRLEGTIGAGGPLLELTTSNGPIRIARN